VREIRGLGLFVGIEFDSGERTAAFTSVCRERGILLGWTLHHDHIVRLAPALNIPEDLLSEAAATLAAAWREVLERGSRA
jgi:acetylornithine/N-succinyldiaminopimelate aminotransferase